jgi:hypothetical protein
MKSVLALVLAVALLASPIAMAGELNTADSEFIFSNAQTETSTLSSTEMADTQGQLAVNLTLGANVDLSQELAAVGSVLQLLLGTVGGLL